MKRKRSLLLSSLMLFAFAMVLTASKPVQAKKVTTYVQTSSKEYHDYDSKFQLMWKTTSKYDKNGNRIAYSSTDYYSSRKGKTTKYKYVYKKNLVQKEYCNNKLITQYSYDKKGNVLKYKYYNNGKLTGVSTNTYKKGKLVSSVTKKGKRKTNETTYYSNGNAKQIIWYDEQERVASKASYNKNGNGSTTYYRYDENGTQIVEGTTTYKVTYKKGVLVKSDTLMYGMDMMRMKKHLLQNISLHIIHQDTVQAGLRQSDIHFLMEQSQERIIAIRQILPVRMSQFRREKI